MRYDRLLWDKRALITGGAGGIGRACAELFARHGATVAICDIDAARGNEALGELMALNPDCAFYRADLRFDAEIDVVCGAYLEKYGAPDVWVHSAGVIRTGYIDQLTDADLEEMLLLGAAAPLRIMRRIAPAMTARGSGSIVMVGSEHSITGANDVSGFAAAMGALHALANAFAMDYARYGIRVNCLLPGVATGSMADLRAADRDFERARHLWSTYVPFSRRAEDGEIASAALFLASDMARYITAEGMFVDGGQHVVSHKENYRKGRWAG